LSKGGAFAQLYIKMFLVSVLVTFYDMYDNADLNLHKDSVGGNIAFLDYVPQFLERTSEHYFNDGRSCSITGYNKDLKIIVNENSVKIKDSSICKWYLKDNIKTMFRGDFQRAIENLSDIVHLPMAVSNVTRLDLATNFLVEHDTSLYYDGLGILNHFNRSPRGSGLYYYGANGSLVFYDKLKDAKANGMVIPSLYDGKNLLRYERRFEKRICQQLNCAELKASTLYDNQFYTQMIDRWVNDYQSIDKIKNVKKLDYNMVKSKTELYSQALLFYIEGRGGILNVLDEVKQAQKAGALTKKQAQDLRDKYKEVSNHKLFVDENDLIQELDSKVKQVQRHYH